MNKLWPLAMSLVATLSSARTLEADDETLPVAHNESAIGESSCKTAKADLTLRLSRNRSDPALPAAEAGFLSLCPARQSRRKAGLELSNGLQVARPSLLLGKLGSRRSMQSRFRLFTVNA
jgi:hypothetical protein